MLDPAIQSFLDERKDAWLKKKIKSNSSGEEKDELEREANDQFALASWLPSAAKRAKQLYVVSHPGKFSHSGAKISPIIAPTDNRRADGFLRTGNVVAELDTLGNAAAMDVYKFLNIKLTDNQTILSHLEKKTPTIEKQLTIPNLSFEEVGEGLLAIKEGDGTSTKTDERIKQVYFPIKDDSYHLLSVLSPSNLMFKLKERINLMRFSDEAKVAREAKRNNKYHQNGYSEVFNLGVIGFGGTKPQNISVLNNQNGGTSYLLLSMPPEIESRSIQPPRTNFFSNTLWAKDYQDDFQELQKLLGGDSNNIHIRTKRDRIVKHIIYQIVDRVWMVRRLDAGWSGSENYESLPHYQKVWLDQQYVGSRPEETEWLQPVKDDLARWFLNTFPKLVKGKGIDIGDEQLSYFKSVIDECEESLR